MWEKIKNLFKRKKKLWLCQGYGNEFIIICDTIHPKKWNSSHAVWRVIDGPFETQEDAAHALVFWRLQLQIETKRKEV